MEEKYTPKRLKSALSSGMSITVFSTGGGYSDTHEWSATANELAEWDSKDKLDIVHKNAVQQLKHTDMGLGKVRTLMIRLS